MHVRGPSSLPGRWTAATFSLALVLFGCSAHSVERVDPGDLVIADSVAGRPTLAIDPASGDVLAAYFRTTDSGADVYFRRIDMVTLDATAPVRVNEVPGDAAPPAQAPAQVAAGPDGTVYATWIAQRAVPGRRFPASDIRLARSDDGGSTFSPAVTVNPDPGFATSHHFHNIAVGADGTVYVSWLDGTARDRAMNAAGREDHPTHTADAHHASHTKDSFPGTELHVSRSTDGGRTFDAPVVLARGTCQCCRTAIVTGTAGDVYVAWRHIFGDSERDVAISHSVDGGHTFGAPVRVHADAWQLDGCPHTGPAMAVDAEGQLHVAWYSGTPSRAGVFYATSTDGGDTFTAPLTLQRDLPIAQVSLAPRGSLMQLAWEDAQADSIRSVLIAETGIENGSATSGAGKYPTLVSERAKWAAAAVRDGKFLLRTGSDEAAADGAGLAYVP